MQDHSSVTDVLHITTAVQGHTYRCSTRTLTAERSVSCMIQNGEQDFRVVCVSITKMQLLQGTFFRNYCDMIVCYKYLMAARLYLLTVF